MSLHCTFLELFRGSGSLRGCFGVMSCAFASSASPCYRAMAESDIASVPVHHWQLDESCLASRDSTDFRGVASWAEPQSSGIFHDTIAKDCKSLKAICAQVISDHQSTAQHASSTMHIHIYYMYTLYIYICIFFTYLHGRTLLELQVPEAGFLHSWDWRLKPSPPLSSGRGVSDRAGGFMEIPKLAVKIV